ncbi:MAG: 5-(carboxyamino)imidazole ribonucleotide synthase [Mycobacteriales bacterium]
MRTGLPVVGMIGAGQLARMTHQAAIGLGQSLRVLAADRDASAALVAADVQIGAHTSYDDLARFAAGCDVVTFDHEHVPGEHIAALAAAGHRVFPGAEALLHAQDKRVMRERLGADGFPVPRWRPIGSAADVVGFADEVGWPVVLKATRGGYDGKGVWTVAAMTDAAELFDPVSHEARLPLLAEERIPLRRELAALAARSPFGQVATWPVVETVQQDGICVEVIAPAPGLSEDHAAQAQELAVNLATDLGVVGILAVELFQTDAGLVINELAMRPHNSGHWTIDGAVTSQFEQHLRAVLDYPLGVTSSVAPWTVMANVLGGDPAAAIGAAAMGLDERVHHLMAAHPAVKLHLYGKAVRPGRKIGHVTATGSDLAALRAATADAAGRLRHGVPAERPQP